MAFRFKWTTSFAAGISSFPCPPTGGTVEVRDRLLAVVSQNIGSAIFTVPLGWTPAAVIEANLSGPDVQTIKVFELKGATGSDLYTFTSDRNDQTQITIAAWSGRHNSAPLNIALPTLNTSPNGTPVSMSGNTGTAVLGDDIAIFGVLDMSGDGGTEQWSIAGWGGSLVQREDAWTAARGTVTALATQDAVTAGAFGAVTATATRITGTISSTGYAMAALALPAAWGSAPVAWLKA